jgi:hypothetical protein
MTTESRERLRTPFVVVENRLEPTAPSLFLTPFAPLGPERAGAEARPRRRHFRQFARSRDDASAARKDLGFPRYGAASLRR